MKKWSGQRRRPPSGARLVAGARARGRLLEGLALPPVAAAQTSLSNVLGVPPVPGREEGSHRAPRRTSAPRAPRWPSASSAPATRRTSAPIRRSTSRSRRGDAADRRRHGGPRLRRGLRDGGLRPAADRRLPGRPREPDGRWRRARGRLARHAPRRLPRGEGQARRRAHARRSRRGHERGEYAADGGPRVRSEAGAVVATSVSFTCFARVPLDEIDLAFLEMNLVRSPGWRPVQVRVGRGRNARRDRQGSAGGSGNSPFVKP